MKVLYTLILFFLFGLHTISAQHHRNHTHNGHNEIGISSGVLYAIDDESWGSGVHVHFFRTLSEHSRWSVGGFTELALLDNVHYAVGAGAKFEAVGRLFVGAFPGVVFAKHNHGHAGHHHGNEKTKAKFSMHLEMVYDLFEWEKFHLGPVVDYSWSKNDSHITLGVHAAYCF